MSRKVVASLDVTLDGFIDEPGLWSFPFWSDEAGQVWLVVAALDTASATK